MWSNHRQASCWTSFLLLKSAHWACSPCGEKDWTGVLILSQSVNLSSLIRKLLFIGTKWCVQMFPFLLKHDKVLQLGREPPLLSDGLFTAFLNPAERAALTDKTTSSLREKQTFSKKTWIESVVFYTVWLCTSSVTEVWLQNYAKFIFRGHFSDKTVLLNYLPDTESFHRNQPHNVLRLSSSKKSHVFIKMAAASPLSP